MTVKRHQKKIAQQAAFLFTYLLNYGVMILNISDRLTTDWVLQS